MDDAKMSGLAKKSENGEDPRQAALKAKLGKLFQEVARVEVELSRVEGAISGVPHYSVIEGRAHELGKQLSCQIQKQQMNELVASYPQTARCPACNTRCELESFRRDAKTIDGETELQELRGHCPRCRRDFFPDAVNPRV